MKIICTIEIPRLDDDQTRREKRIVQNGHVVFCLDETSPVFRWQGTVSGQPAFDKRVRPAALRKGEKLRKQKV